MSEYDCQTCGACCTNVAENAGSPFYVEIAPSDAILQRKDLVTKLVVLDDDGVPHLRLDETGRCLALAGKLGRSVRCTIYHHRPSPCRRVEAGSPLCLRYRAEKGMSPATAKP